MKKLLAIILVLSMLTGVVSTVAFAKESDTLNFSVMTDPQTYYDYIYTGKQFKNILPNTQYNHVGDLGRLTYDAFPVIDEFFKIAAQNDSDYILVPGDLTEDGTVVGSEEMAARFAAFEEETGKQIYVISGNHDFYNVDTAYKSKEDEETNLPQMTPDKFKEIFNQFGYDEALSVDENSASYVVDLDNNYRLICFDTASHQYLSESVLTQARVDWLKNEVIKAEEAGKRTIVMMHHSLVEHSILGSELLSDQAVDAEWGLPEFFAKHSIKYVISGHIHAQDVASYKATNGKTVYDIATGTITTYPCPYRNISFSDEKVEIETEYIEEIDTSAIDPERVNPELIAYAAEDFPAYAKECLRTGINYKMYWLLCHQGLSYKFGIKKYENPEEFKIINDFTSKLYDAFMFPLYEADADDNGVSLEKYAKAYGTYFPESEYETMFDLICEVYHCTIRGDENYPLDSVEITLLTNALAVAMNYTLTNYSSEEYAALMNLLVSVLVPEMANKLPVDYLVYAGDAIKRFDGCEIYITCVVAPFFSMYTTDSGPEDNNLTLPGFEAEEEITLNGLFSILIDFLESIFSFVNAILNRIKMW